MGIERQKELRRRRHRRKKLDQMKKKLDKASVSEKSYMSTKIRRLTPGAETIISSLALDER